MEDRKNDFSANTQMQDGQSTRIDFLKDVALQVSLELGLAEVTIGDFLKWKPGMVIVLEKREDESLEFRINGRLAARGEPVIVNEKYGVRITSIVEPDGNS